MKKKSWIDEWSVETISGPVPLLYASSGAAVVSQLALPNYNLIDTDTTDLLGTVPTAQTLEAGATLSPLEPEIIFGTEKKVALGNILAANLEVFQFIRLMSKLLLRLTAMTQDLEIGMLMLWFLLH